MVLNLDLWHLCPEKTQVQEFAWSFKVFLYTLGRIDPCLSICRQETAFQLIIELYNPSLPSWGVPCPNGPSQL